MAARPIPPAFRLGLAAKGGLLLGLGGLLLGLGVAAAVKDEWPWAARAAAALGFGAVGLFPALQARVAFFDALAGEAEEVRGAVALRSRRSGLSFSLPGGRFAEFLLWNTFAPLVPDATYTLVVARRSRVIVAPPARTSG